MIFVYRFIITNPPWMASSFNITSHTLYEYRSFSRFTQQLITCFYGYVFRRSEITGTFLFVEVPYLYAARKRGLRVRCLLEARQYLFILFISISCCCPWPMLCDNELWSYQWILNWKWCRRNRLPSRSRYYPDICMKGLK